MPNRRFKLIIIALMACSLSSISSIKINTANSAAFYTGTSKTELLQKPMIINGGSQRIIMKLRNMNVKDLLRLLATKAGFNILFDDTVTGEISVDFNNVTINQALETVKDYANLIYMQDNATLVVAGKESGLAKSINQQVTQFIPIKYINAKLVAALLNSTIFANSSSSSSNTTSKNKASTEFRTNSVIIVGTDNDIRLAEDTISKIDIPRQTQTFKINNTDVLYITQLLQATIFNDGINPYNNQAGSASNGALATKSSPLTVITETYEEGSSNEVTGASTGESTSGGTAKTQKLRTKKLSNKDINISPDGPIIIPDTRSSTITIMGTSEQLQLAASIIPTLDEKLPQVAIETALVDLSDESMKTLRSTWGQSSGQWASGYNNGVDASVVNKAFTPPFGIPNLIGLPSPSISGSGASGLLAFTTSPLSRSTEFLYNLKTMISNGKARLLANPTVVAMHNSESVINITEEIIKKSTTTLTLSGGGANALVEVEIGEAGIFLNILPQVTRDGYINLKIHPLVSSPYSREDIGEGYAILLRKRDFSAQTVRVANGQTLALGGLIQESSRIEREVIPGLGDLPLIGALFSTNEKQHARREVLMLMTPRILTDSNQKIVSSFDTKPLVDVLNNKNHQLISPKEETSKQNN